MDIYLFNIVGASDMYFYILGSLLCHIIGYNPTQYKIQHNYIIYIIYMTMSM